MTAQKEVLRRGDLKAATGLSIATIYRMIARGTFPKPIQIGLKAVGWLRADIEAWMQGRRALAS